MQQIPTSSTIFPGLSLSHSDLLHQILHFNYSTTLRLHFPRIHLFLQINSLNNPRNGNNGKLDRFSEQNPKSMHRVRRSRRRRLVTLGSPSYRRRRRWSGNHLSLIKSMHLLISLLSIYIYILAFDGILIFFLF